MKHTSRPACDSRRAPLPPRRVGCAGTKAAILEHVIVSPIVGVLQYPYPRAYVEIAECLEVTLLESRCRNSYLLPPLNPWGGSAQQSRGEMKNVSAARGTARSWRAQPLVDVGFGMRIGFLRSGASFVRRRSFRLSSVQKLEMARKQMRKLH